MSSDKPLSDNQVHDALYAAEQALGTAPGATVRGNTAIVTARNALRMLQIGLVAAMDKNADRIEGVIDQPTERD